MEYNSVKFEGIIATPGIGKSYLCDRYPLFVDADEIRLRCKYEVPENFSREQREITKGEHPFKKKPGSHTEEIYKTLDSAVKKGKIIIASPHPEFYDYFKSRNILFCFIYPEKNTREELVKRFRTRKNPEELVQRFAGEKEFEVFYEMNLKENRAVVKYEFKKDEYLTDIIKKFGIHLKETGGTL